MAADNEYNSEQNDRLKRSPTERWVIESWGKNFQLRSVLTDLQLFYIIEVSSRSVTVKYWYNAV